LAMLKTFMGKLAKEVLTMVEISLGLGWKGGFNDGRGPSSMGLWGGLGQCRGHSRVNLLGRSQQWPKFLPTWATGEVSTMVEVLP
jgi:hypothetical protein